MMVHEQVLQSLRDWGKHPAIIEVQGSLPDRFLAAGELLQGIEDTASFLRSSGVLAGMPLAMFLGSSASFLQVFIAACTLGAVPVPLKMEYRRLELEEIFANCAPPVIIAEDQHLPFLQPYAPQRTVISCREGRLRIVELGCLPAREAELGQDIAALLYTYRGHGYPLAAMIPHGQLLQGARSFQERTQGKAGEKLLFSLPMSHILTLVGCVLVPLLNRMTVVIARTIHPQRIFAAIDRHRIERIVAVPELYSFFLRLLDRGADLSSLRVLVSGGSNLPAGDFLSISEAFGAELLNGYGLTEFAPVSGHYRGAARPGTLGPAGDPIEVRLEEGEIAVRFSDMFRGYYHRPTETRDAFRAGWFMTGDLGSFDADHLVFLGERKKTCKVNGSMVDLEEVRRAILRDPDIAAATVEGGRNRIDARIAISHRIDIREKSRDLVALLRTLLADNKMPTRIDRM